MALCLSLVGDGLMKGKQQRDAMLRLEEALGIYRGILGNTSRSIDVGRSLNAVARALAKIGENRVALLKFAEATRIYDACNANLQYDAISNAQNYASLLVDVGDWSSADAKFEEVFTAKKTVYGANSVPVAKAINSYAILLAKYGRMDKALFHYERAMAIYQKLPPPVILDPEFDMKCKYDVTLINLNIASIRSKKGDLKGAIRSYEEGVNGLREHAEEQAALLKAGHTGEAVKSTSQHKHLVAALGRIGSLKLKMGDFDGALEAYTTLLQEVDEDSPATSRVEKAKAHIKCATIYRQEDTKESRIKSISHLREALDMYTVLFGEDHKDTTAIASSLKQWLSEDRETRTVK
jgi:tetratricopeptide (TPR) repeat protein